jgi:CRP/FNR family transcriptional regulator, anaerobic regulatory protein
MMDSESVLFDFLKNKLGDFEHLKSEVISKFFCIAKEKNEVLVHKGETCRYMYFLVNGITRNFYVDYQGREYTRLITYQNKFFTNFLSFQKQIPSKETIECLEATQLLAITKNDFDTLIANHPSLLKLFAFEVVEYHNYHLEKLEFLSLLTPTERLQYIWLHEKELLSKISNKLLASYIGVKQETCSRLKKELFKT